MMKKKLNFLGIELELSIRKKQKPRKTEPVETLSVARNAKLNFGPGPNWAKPGADWYSIDVDPQLGDIVVDFQQFESLPFKSNSIQCVYGSHVFEHMSIFVTPLIFSEIYRVLKKGSIFRLILPDAEKSIREYLNGNQEFLLFKRRKERARKHYNREYTLFECMKEDFLSPSGQVDLLGENALAHQNAWDFNTIKSDLVTAGFEPEKVKKMDFQKSQSDLFDFEGTYRSEANEDYRSLYVEAVK